MLVPRLLLDRGALLQKLAPDQLAAPEPLWPRPPR
jgi:hypothetical protein